MSNVTPVTPKGPLVVSKIWDDVPRDNSDLKAGVALSFPILALGQREWIVRWKGEDRLVKIPGTEFPAPYVDVVILNAQKDMSRMYYRDPYQKGQRGKKPDCWSSNGIKPDESIPQPVNAICATCPMSAWGSSGSAVSPKSQACQQRRRTVVVPYGATDGFDLTNAAEGGPMLLSVPPASLSAQVKYGELLDEKELADGSRGVFYAAAVTRLSFEPGLKYSRIQFGFEHLLTDEESLVIKNLRNAEAVKRILTSKIGGDEAEGSPDEPASPGIPPAPMQPTPPKVPPQAATPKPAKASPPPPPKTPGGYAATGITEAVAQPAAPPPSQRPLATEPPVIKHMPPAVMEDDDDEAKEIVPGVSEDALFKRLMEQEDD